MKANKEKKLVKYAIVLIMIPFIVTGCESISTNNFCDLYTPVKTLPKSIPQSIDVDKNNAIYLDLCL